MELTTNLLLRINLTSKRMEINVFIADDIALKEVINSCYLGKVTAQIVFMEWLEWCEENHFNDDIEYAKFMVLDAVEYFKIDEEEIDKIKGRYPQKYYEYVKNNIYFDSWNELEKFIIETSLEKSFLQFVESLGIDINKHLEHLILKEVAKQIEDILIF
jgi:hypothetical protein